MRSPRGRVLFPLFAVGAFVTVHSPAFAVPSETAIAGLQVRDEGQAGVFEVRIKPNGRTGVVTGRFDIGNPERTASAVGDAVCQFLSSHGEVFDFSADRCSTLDEQTLAPLFDGWLLFSAQQFIAGQRVEGGELRVVLDNAGYLISAQVASIPSTFDPGAASEAGLARALGAAFGEWKQVERVAPHLATWDVAAGARQLRAERVISGHSLDVTWLFTDDDEIVRVSSDGSTVLERVSRVVHANKTAHVKETNWPGAGTSYVTDWVKYWTWVYPADFCSWALGYDAGAWQINRVVNLTGPEAEVGSPCSVTPWMPASSTSDHDQQNVLFRLVKDVRHFMISKVTTGVSASGTDALNVELNATQAQCSAPTGTIVEGCYNTGSHRLRMTSNADLLGGDVAAVVHEIGHYWHHMYGAPTTQCSPGVHEASPVTEALAENLVQLYAFERDPAFDYARVLTGSLAPHKVGTGEPHVHGCVNFPLRESQQAGQFFYQAVREAIYDVDCTDADCSCSSGCTYIQLDDGFVNWSWSSAILHMSRAIYYAALVSGSTPDFENITANMRTYLIGAVGVTKADKVREIFAHHDIAM